MENTMNDTMNSNTNATRQSDGAKASSRQQQQQDAQSGQPQGSHTNQSSVSTRASASSDSEKGERGVQRGEPPGTQRAMLPAVDIVEDEAGITLLADLPGVSRDQLGIKVTGDNLMIEAAASAPVGDDMELIYGEVQSLQYRRSFTLSRELDPGKIDAKLTNGVLRLRIPKAEEARPRRIEVSVG
jgi:HSP20 family protein